jgi:methylenetetrahydrofolate reductase (NADPH)
MTLVHSKNNTTRASTDPLLASLDAFSVEIGINESKSLDKIVHRLPAGTEVFLNVLHGETFEDRIRTCQRLASLGMTPVPHIGARLLKDKHEVRTTLQRFMREADVEHVLIIAGDLEEPVGDIRDSIDLLQAIDTTAGSVRKIGISGYPERHPYVSSDILLRLQDEKIARIKKMGIEPFIVTQFSFDANAIIRYCGEVHARYPHIQIRIGLPGPAKLTTLIRFAQRCGVRSSLKKLRALPLSTSLRLMQRLPPAKQAEAVGKYRMEQNDNVTVHLFTFGGLEASLDWIAEEIAARSAEPDA